MAKETKLANKVDKRDTKKKEAKPNIFVRFIGFCKDVVAELKRVSWPTKKEFINYTLAVIAFVAVCAILVGALDFAFGAGMQLLIK